MEKSVLAPLGLTSPFQVNKVAHVKMCLTCFKMCLLTFSFIPLGHEHCHILLLLYAKEEWSFSGCWWLCVNACSLITTTPGWLVREDAISLWPLSHQENVSRTRKPAVTPFPVTISQKSVRQLQFPKMGMRGLGINIDYYTKEHSWSFSPWREYTSHCFRKH